MTPTKPGPNGNRSYQRHGLTDPIRTVRALGTEAIDGRTRLGRAMQTFRDELTEDLGGEENLSAQQRAIVEQVCVDRILLALIDGFIFGRADPGNPLTNVLNKRDRKLYPIVSQRQQIADAFTSRLVRLGLKRQAVEAYDLDSYVQENYAADVGAGE